jgi:hypothetical protein
LIETRFAAIKQGFDRIRGRAGERLGSAPWFHCEVYNLRLIVVIKIVGKSNSELI